MTNQDLEANGADTSPTRAPAARRRSIDLDIAGADLMLRGRFETWESGLALGPDLDRAGVRLAVDATSSAVHAASAEAPSLFAFHSRTVEPDGPGSYRASGTFTGPLGDKPLELLIETRLGHTALFTLSFRVDKHDFGDAGWEALVENAVPSGQPAEGEPVRIAHAWLLPPVLAAA